MHPEAREFTLFVKQILLDYFVNKRVLDVGSGDINGNNRFLFENCEYNGNDVIQTNNVTIVSKTKDLPFEDNTFDTIISTECFEHDPEYKESFVKIYNMLKPDGLFLFTCASIGRAEHGTRRTSPGDSYGTIGGLEDMSDYYKNLTEIDLNEILPLNTLFTVYDSYYNSYSSDLYFVGIKKGTTKLDSLKKYENYWVENTLSNTGVNNTLNTIFNKYDTDKNMFFHNYTRQYDTLLNNFKDKPVKYLEIGVYNGGSVKAFRETFVNSTCILGLDIDNNCKKYENIDNNIFIEIGNATDSNFIKEITAKYGTFDIILDDGSHINREVIQSFELLFPLLNNNGLYIVEDTICYKSPNYIDNNYPNHLQYFFDYTKYLNQWRYDSEFGRRDNCIDPFKIMKNTKNVFEYSIDKIEYGCSYIAISKKIRQHWI
jgi:SAM-dependent methyltransferase/cephalosporin hydroxylase